MNTLIRSANILFENEYVKRDGNLITQKDQLIRQALPLRVLTQTSLLRI